MLRSNGNKEPERQAAAASATHAPPQESKNSRVDPASPSTSRRVRAGSPFDEMPPEVAAAQGKSGGGGGCRLNVLPEHILLRVLGHLKAWEAVRTSLLSKRWRGLWASAPRLDIRQPCGCPGGGEDDQRRMEQFAAFVKHLLFRRRQLLPLGALRLCWSHPTRDGDANTWIANAVRHGAEVIELSGAHHSEYPSPYYLSFVPSDTTEDMCLKIVKLIHVRLDDATLRQLCSRCTRLEELELEDCLIQGKEIRSTSLKCLNMISGKFVDGFRIDCPNLVSLRCIRPFRYIPRIQNMKHLVTVTILLDDLCLHNNDQWIQQEDQKDEFDDGDDFFPQAGSEDSGDNSFADSAAEESGDNNHNMSDDNSNDYDSDWSGQTDDEGDDRTVCYSEIADEHNKKPYKYLINGNNRNACGPRDDCGGNSNFGGSEFFRVNGIPYEKIFVYQTASSSSAEGDAGSPAKRKAENEAEDRDAKQRKQGN
ncbi:hypothetical protein PR202_ga27509 [Eleusine coracana subsp. coracana]|uniref:F-box domain-containing protein n=1 Tax=Eleusine coracana subsp. coracana TaxID=191504 RepID=A0AAV5DGE8_ELECO|nr:hypothetical protein PR202_ga27509 [Eleusine coracana subsp. coracana]